MILKLGLVTSILFFSCAYAEPNQQQSAGEMVSELTHSVLVKLHAEQANFERHPELLKSFTIKYILPYIDTAKMARYVTGRNWKNATKAQQKAFTHAFTEMLLNSYSSALLKYHIKSMKVVKVEGRKKTRQSITTEVIQESGDKLKVVYRAYQNKKTHKWMLYDVSFEGISLLVNYRKSFTSEIDKKGFDQVIQELEAKNDTP